tara:strand:- start:23169 stop:23744 length:576 start_codon:yes stop_codon:yes gene_type:complete
MSGAVSINPPMHPSPEKAGDDDVKLGENEMVEAPLKSFDGNFRTASDTRLLALQIHRSPIPNFTREGIGQRYQIGPDSVRKHLNKHGVVLRSKSDVCIPLTDILLWEGVHDPLTTWVLGSDEDRKILSADLLTLEEWLMQFGDESFGHSTKYYRGLADGKYASIRIGRLHRFRPKYEAITGARTSLSGEGS